MRTHEAGALHADVTEPPSALLVPPADPGALAAAVWPATATRDESGALLLGGVDVRDLATEFGTPAYLLDEADFRSRCRDFVQAFAGADVHYAAKAFCSLTSLRWIVEEGLGLDVCSGGELAAALRAEVPPDRIAFHGNNKSVAELEQALDAGVGRIVVDSFAEIARLAWLAEERGLRQAVLVRATVGVEAHTHEFIATAHEDQKFGFSIASRRGSEHRRELATEERSEPGGDAIGMAGGDAFEACRRVLNHSSLDLVGVHSHIGSQIFDTSGFEVSAHRAVALLARLRDELGATPPYLDLGGGFGIAYTAADTPMDVPALAASMRAIVARECAAAGLAEPRLAVEPGRAIAGPASITLYEVGTVKDTPHRRYVSVDGGMSDNIRTALYDAQYTCVLASRVSEVPPVLCRVVGKHCESGDIVVRDTWLPADLVPGDLLAVAATGAYCRSLASNYNHQPRPPVVAVGDGAARVVVRRETVEDLLRLDVP